MPLHPVFSVFGPGNNGSSVLFWSIHSAHHELPQVPLLASEEQRYNKFHLHSFDSLEAVMDQFPDRRHRIFYPVRRDVERQVISTFIRYAGKIEKRPHDLGLPPGRWSDWSTEDVISAFEQYVELQRMPECFAEYHRHFFQMFDLQPAPLFSAQVYERDRADVLIVPSEAIHDSTASLEAFTAPSRFTPTSAHRTSNDRAVLVKLLRPHVRRLLHRPLLELRAEFPELYDESVTENKTGLWAQLRSLLHLPQRNIVAAH